MALPNCNVNTDVISNLADTPSLTPAELKEKFDKEATDLKGYINTLLNPAIENLVQDVKDSILNKTYPVGSIYMSTNSTSPANIFGGTWEIIKDRFLLSAGDDYTSGQTGGEKEHRLERSELPNYVLGFKGVSWVGGHNGGVAIANRQSEFAQNAWKGEQSIDLGGGGEAHNNMPPYLVVNMWKRTA